MKRQTRRRAGARPVQIEVREDADVAQLIAGECDAVKEMLLAKNARYGNSALDPVRVFARSGRVEQIKVRLDDKLSRLARGTGEETEDVEADMMGYLVLLRVARKLEEREARLTAQKERR